MYLILLFPEFAQIKPQLFAKYIPNVLPATSEKDLERYIQETKEMQSALYNIPEFRRFVNLQVQAHFVEDLTIIGDVGVLPNDFCCGD